MQRTLEHSGPIGQEILSLNTFYDKYFVFVHTATSIAYAVFF